MNDMEKTLRDLLNRGADLAALTAALRQQTQAMTDLLARLEASDGNEKKPEEADDKPDTSAPLLAAIQALVERPQPEPAAPILHVTPTLTTAPGTAWKVEGKGPGGHPFSMVITKL